MREHSRRGHDIHIVATGTRRSAHIHTTPLGRERGIIHRLGVVAALMFWASTAACATLLHSRTTESPNARSSTLATAQSMALEKRFDAADSTLARFAILYPRTPQALETAFWRGLFKMDPANPNATLATAISLLDTYLEDSRDSDHVAEARTMRRAAAKLEGLTRVAENAVSEAREASNTAANAKAQAANANARAEAAKTEATPSTDAEVKRLKDELAKANAELERIRKRLTQPPQKP